MMNLGKYLLLLLSLLFLVILFLPKFFILLILVVLAVCVFFIFRSSPRVGDVVSYDLVLSPADGKVVSIDRMDDGRYRVVIFTGVFDCHTIRMPYSGVVQSVESNSSKFNFIDKSNEIIKKALIRTEIGNVEILLRSGWYFGASEITADIGKYCETSSVIGYNFMRCHTEVIVSSEFEPVVNLSDKVQSGTTLILKRVNV